MDIPADALPLEVIDEGRGHMKDVPARITHEICPVRFFKEKKVALVKHSHIFDGLFAHQEAGTDARINLHRFVITVTLARITIGEEIFEEGSVGQQCDEIRETRDRILLASVCVEELTAGHGRL